jgi:phosphoglycolate phosphatase
MTQPILVFDLDGTLVDTAEDLMTSLNHTLAGAGLDAMRLEQMHPWLGHGGRTMLEKSFAAQNRVIDADTMRDQLTIFLDHYRANLPGVSRPYAGVMEAIEVFSQAGFIHAVCTNKLEAMSVGLLDGLGISGRFKAICGQDTFAYRKPDPRHLLDTIAAAGGDPARAIMIGDTETDIRTAQAARIPSIAVDFGYSSVPVAQFAPDMVISSYRELTPELAGRMFATA